MKRFLSKHGSLVLAVACLLAIQACIPLRGFWLTDSAVKYLQMINITERHHFRDFSIDYPLQDRDPDRRLSLIARYKTVHGGRLYCMYPPAFSFVSGVFFWLFGLPGAHIVPLLGTVFLLMGCVRLARLGGLRWPGLAASFALFGTPLLPYAFTFWEMLPAMGFGIWALTLGVEARLSGSMRRAAAAGVFAGLALILREQYLLWAACLTVCLALPLRHWRIGIAFGASFSAIALILALWNKQMVGWPLLMRMWTTNRNPVEAWSFQTRHLTAYQYLAFVTPPGLNGIRYDFVFLDLLFFAGLAVLAFVPTSSWPRRFALCGAALLSAAAVRDFAWNNVKPMVSQFHINSMAATTPAIFFAFGRRSRHARLHTPEDPLAFGGVVAVVFLLANIASSPLVSAIGFNFGPRIVLAAYPPLVLRAWGMAEDIFADKTFGVAWERLAARGTKALLIALFALGLADSVVYLHRLRMKKELSARNQDLVIKTAPLPIVTDLEWFGVEVSPLCYRRTIMYAATPEKQLLALKLARQMSPNGAVLIAAGDPSETIRRACAIEPLPEAQAMRFPDSLFSFVAYRLRW